ncbi:MAG: LysE family translocator [Cyclobacteriaceae bacterium]
MIVFNGIKLGLLLAFLVGPVFFTILQTSIERGFLRGALVAVGVSISDAAYVTLCYLGLTQILEQKAFHSHLALVGGGILVVFGMYYLFVKSRRKITQGGSQVRGQGFYRYIAKGFLINGFSPMVPLFWIGTLSIATIDFGYTTTFDLTVFIASMLTTVLVTDILKAYLADKVRRVITSRLLMAMNIVIGVVLIGFGARLIMLAPGLTNSIL